MSYEGGNTVHSEDLPWLPLAPKVDIKVLNTDEATGEFSVMIRAAPGGVLPRHQHIESAEILILKGAGHHPQTGDYRVGDYITEPKGALHDAVEFGEETLLFMTCKGPSAFLAPDDSVMHVMNVPMLRGLAAAHARA